MLFLTSFAAVIIPIIAFIFVTWKFNGWIDDSINLTIKGLLYGGIGAIFISLFISLFLYKIVLVNLTPQNLNGNIEPIIFAPVIEELTKCLLVIFIIRRKKFSTVTQGIILGSAVGLGFAMIENLFYFVVDSHLLSNLISLVFYRTFFSAVMHCTATGFFGAFAGYIFFFNPRNKISFYMTGFATAIMIHAVWNFCAAFDMLSKFGFGFIILIAAAFTATYIFSTIQEKKIILSELEEESMNGLIPEKHLKYINSSKRNQKGWVDEGIRKAYIKAVTSLAFKKICYKNAANVNKEKYDVEIANYRDLVSSLLK